MGDSPLMIHKEDLGIVYDENYEWIPYWAYILGMESFIFNKDVQIFDSTIEN